MSNNEEHIVRYTAEEIDEMIEWFREQGPGYQTPMNQVLRSYVEA